MKDKILLPDLYVNLQRLKENIFDSFSCMQIGKIVKFDKTAQTADIEIQAKYKVTETKVVDYPVLADCPVIFMQGGGAYLEFPIKADDYCVVFFNDIDIDIWYSAASIMPPNTTRKHNLSDGIALVGLNPATSVLNLSNDKVRINAGNYPIVLETTSGKIEIAVNGNITMNEGTEPYVLGTQLTTQLTTILTALQTFTTGLNVTTLSAQAATMATACGTALGLLEQLKSTQIKGK